MKKKLLLADDSVTIQKVVQITFSSDDYDLTVVDNGDIAYEKARSQRPDLILADVFMPGKNGYELCAAVKNDPSLAAVPVLLLTGTFEPFDEAKARSVGADRWIAKPFESQALIACVEELLTQAATQAPTQAPTIAPPVFIPISAPAPEPVAVDEFAPPDLSSDLPDDLWGSEFDAEGASGSADLPAADAFAATNQDDLWDVSGFEAEAPVAADADDLWGSFEATPAVAVPLAPADEAVPLADESWGSDDFTTAFASEPTGAAAPFVSDAAEVPLADDFEILEEIDLLEPAADSSPDISLTDTFSPDDFSFEEESVQPEVVEAPSVLVAPVPVPPLVTPPPLSVVDVVPPVTAIPAAPEAATSGATLSDAQMDLIVERVAEVVITRLTGTLLEKIAWEVVPDLAETMIKEELRKIREAVAAG